MCRACLCAAGVRGRVWVVVVVVVVVRVGVGAGVLEALAAK